MTAPARIGRYRVDRRIGSGGFATVWLAYDEMLESDVAVKVLADNWTDQLDVRARFLEEARILRRADSDHVVRVHDIGELPDGRPYFVMTYADEGTLEDRLDAGPLPIGTALHYARGVAQGLAVLHGLHVVHRDVKPSNVLFARRRDEDGERILLADLGLARAIAHASGFTLAAGTPGYMAPEQAVVGGSVDERADVFGLGALLVHMLTGKRIGLVSGPPDGIPAELAAVIRSALAENPADRYPTGGAMAEALDRLGGDGRDRRRDAQRLGTSGPAATTMPFSRFTDAPADAGPPALGPARPTGRDSPGRPTDRPQQQSHQHRQSQPPQRAQAPQEPQGAQQQRPRPAPDRPPDQQSGPQPAQTPRDQPQRSGPPSGGGHSSADDPSALTEYGSRGMGRWILAGAVIVLLAAVGGVVLALDPFASSSTKTVRDASHAVSIQVPAAWAKQVRGEGWSTAEYFGVKATAAGLAAAPDLAAFEDARSTGPGVLVGVSKALAARTDEQLLGDVTHPGCTVADHDAGNDSLSGTGRRYTCSSPGVRYDDIALRPVHGDYVVFLQIKEGADENRADDLVRHLAVTTPAS